MVWLESEHGLYNNFNQRCVRTAGSALSWIVINQISELLNHVERGAVLATAAVVSGVIHWSSGEYGNV